jgi:hypothetical protein
MRDLAGQLELVKTMRDRNPSNPIWGLLRQRWEAEVVDARRGLEAYERGARNADQKFLYSCNRIILSIHEDGRVDAMLDALIAVALLERLEGRRTFKTDEAFKVQAGRVMRNFSRKDVGARWNKGKCVKRYRDVSRRALEWVGQAGLKMVFQTATTIWDMEVKRVEDEHAEKAAVKEALETLR